MSRSTPTWIVKDLAEVLGFDEETVSTAILPELDSQTHQVRLRSHLEDFLGPSPKAKSFINRYIAHRFPNIPTPSPAPAPSLKAATAYPLNARPQSTAASGSRTPASGFGGGGGSGSSTPDLGRAVSDAFGPGGSVYTKNKNDALDHGRIGGHTAPQFRQPGRPGGALSIHEAKPRSDSKGKGKAAEGKGDKIWDIPKSRETKRLEGIKDKLTAVQAGEKVSRGERDLDCFCQARIHVLSTYTPQCASCGLTVCSINPAYLPCPSCHNLLYTPAQLARLLLRLTNDIETQLDHEQAVRDAEDRERRERLIAESGGGAFPTLPGSQPRSGTTTPGGGRKVISIGKGGKGKTTVTTTTYKPPTAPSAGASTSYKEELPRGTISRPRSPALDAAKIEKELAKVVAWRKEEDRPWGDLKGDQRGDGLVYIELPISHWVEESSEGRRKTAKKKKKEQALEERKAIPGAA